MPLGEAVVFFDSTLAHEFDYRCKQAGQLASKMRFLAAPWIGMLETGAYLRHAGHANDCARRLATRLAEIPGVRLPYPCQANAVFAEMADAAIDRLHCRGWHFYSFIGTGSARFMCSWATTDQDVEDLVSDVRLAMTFG
jgi:threonine aldolase